MQELLEAAAYFLKERKLPKQLPLVVGSPTTYSEERPLGLRCDRLIAIRPSQHYNQFEALSSHEGRPTLAFILLIIQLIPP